ncbi:PRP38 family-domain-containing protein [Haematococcus lacustris]
MTNPFPYSNSSTFNLESVLRQNVLSSDYYNKTCLEFHTSDEVVDEIYQNVQHVEPWMSGNARGPSTAFCLLYRLFSLGLSVGEVRQLVDHKDSPYIRAVGFLFLRYVCDSKLIWKWCENYADDQEEFAPSPDGRKITMGDFVRDILLEQYYFETIFPRIPKTVMDAIVEELKSRQLPHVPKGNAGTGGGDRRGVDDGNRRPASVKASLSVAMGQRAPNRSGAKEDRNASALNTGSRGGGTGSNGSGRADTRGGGDRPPHSRSYDTDRARDRSPAGYRGGRSTSGRDSYQERSSYHERGSGREAERRDVSGSGQRGERDNDRERARWPADRDCDSGRERRGGADRERDRERGYDRGSGRERERGRGDSRDRERSRRSRSRSPAPGASKGRDARDVFKESARNVVNSSTAAALSRY